MASHPSVGVAGPRQGVSAFRLSAAFTTNTDPIWNGGAGAWSSGAKWTGGVPTATTDASIDGGKAIASPVNLDIAGAQVHNLTIDSDDSLTFLNGASLTVNGTSISTAGHIILNSSGATTQLIPSGGVTLSGAGTLTMSDNANNLINNSVFNGSSFTNQSTIQGAGEIRDGNNSMTNSGTIDATSKIGNQLSITGGGAVKNTGILEATGGGTLDLSGTAITNIGGTISAGSGSTVLLVNATINGGTLSTSGTGAIQSNCCLQASILNGVTNNGTFQVGNQSSASLQGTVTNNGSIQVNATGTGTSSSLGMSGAVTLKGSGTVTMSDNPDNRLGVQNGGASLTNQSTIQGAGTITVGSSSNSITNQGTISATSAMSNQLIINVNPSGTFTNTGKLQAINGGTLNLQGTFNDAGGTISAGNGTTVQLVDATVNGGTLSTSGTGAIQSNCCLQASILNGVTNNGTFQVGNQSSASLQGTVTNNGSIRLNSVGNTSSLNIIGAVILKGSGSLTMSDASTNTLSVQNGGASLTNQSTIQGAGTINMGNNNMTNQGTVAATGTNPLIVTGGGTFTNKGTLTTKAGSLMHITSLFSSFGGGTLTAGTYNTSGTLQIDSLGTTGGEIVTNAANIILNGTGSSFVDASGKDALLNLNTNAVGSSFTITGGRNFTTNHIDSALGAFTNNGTLTVGSASKFDVNGNLTNFSGTTLTGGTYALTGTLQFNGANIVTNASNITLTGTSSQIINQSNANGLANLATNATTGKFTVTGGRIFTTLGAFTNNGSLTTTGSGSKFNTASANFINNGVLATTGGDSEVATGSLGVFTNNGTLTVGSGSTFTTGGSFSNFSGTTLTRGNYNLTGTFQFAGANIVTNVANITLTGTSSKILNSTNGVNGLTNFATNAGKGGFTINGGRNFTTAGSFTNAGMLTIGSGSAFMVGGSGSMTQTGGITTDDGTLSVGSLLTVSGGSLLGKGTVSGNVTSSGTITPGDSSTKTGILTDNGIYTQSSTGTLDISIGGITAGTNFDELNTKTATLNGTLNVSLINGFVPTIGSTFKIMSFTSETGKFSKVNGLSISPTEHFMITYQGADVLLTVVSGAAPSVSRLNTLSDPALFGGTKLRGVLGDNRSSPLNPKVHTLVGRAFDSSSGSAKTNFAVGFRRANVLSNLQPVSMTSDLGVFSIAIPSSPRLNSSLRTWSGINNFQDVSSKKSSGVSFASNSLPLLISDKFLAPSRPAFVRTTTGIGLFRNFPACEACRTILSSSASWGRVARNAHSETVWGNSGLGAVPRGKSGASDLRSRSVIGGLSWNLSNLLSLPNLGFAAR